MKPSYSKRIVLFCQILSLNNLQIGEVIWKNLDRAIPACSGVPYSTVQRHAEVIYNHIRIRPQALSPACDPD